MAAKSGPYYEAVQRAKTIYHDRIKHELGDDLDGQWIVINTSTGEYAADEDFMRAWYAMKHHVAETDRVFVHDGEFLPGHLGGFARALWTSMPQEDQDSVPHDGSLNYKHYLYGFPKQDKYYWEE